MFPQLWNSFRFFAWSSCVAWMWNCEGKAQVKWEPRVLELSDAQDLHWEVIQTPNGAIQKEKPPVSQVTVNSGATQGHWAQVAPPRAQIVYMELWSLVLFILSRADFGPGFPFHDPIIPFWNGNVYCETLCILFYRGSWLSDSFEWFKTSDFRRVFGPWASWFLKWNRKYFPLENTHKCMGLMGGIVRSEMPWLSWTPGFEHLVSSWWYFWKGCGHFKKWIFILYFILL